jgi:hypothetical protein
MRRHDEALLWEYASRELSPEEVALLQHHLDECPDCREKLIEVRTAHQLLADAKATKPLLDWEKVDAGISAVVERRLAAKARSSRLQWVGLATAAVGVAFALASFFLWPRTQAPAPVAVPQVAQAPVEEHQPFSHVDQALRLTKVGARDVEARQGDLLAEGDVLRTGAGGRGDFHLADQSRVRLAGQSELTLMRAEADDVALSLERGKVAVHASHAKRRGFVVHAAGLVVRVIGTVFEVNDTGRAVEVAVSEGRVEVEPPRGEAFFVDAGERVRFDAASWKSQQGRLSAAEKKDLSELLAAEPGPEPMPPGVAPSASEVVASKGGPLPRLAKNDPRTQRHEVQLPEAGATGPVLPAADTQVTVEAPLASRERAPDAPPVQGSAPGPQSSPSEWATPDVVPPACRAPRC